LNSPAFIDAQQPGGKHHGFYLQYRDVSEYLIRRAVRSLSRRIEDHEDKLRYPEKYIPNFEGLRPEQRDALLNRIWPNEITKFQEQIAILEGILQQRGSD
jgi:hypothetical protein